MSEKNADTTSIGIAFGAGGARGIAHLLMIEALDELGLKPSIISGSSIGAVVGAFCAAGFSSKEMKEILNQLINPKSDSVFDFLLKSDIVKMFTIPKMRDYKYDILLIYDENNKKFMEEGYAVGGVTRYGNDLFLKYYRILNNPNNEDKYNTVIEENIVFQYETKDYTIYVLKNIHQERITREVKNISLEEI